MKLSTQCRSRIPVFPAVAMWVLALWSPPPSFAAITVDKQYTFNDGPEADLVASYKTGSEAPIYGGGQVLLGPGTYLKGAALYALAPVNFGIEVVLAQTSDTMEERWILDTNPGYQLLLNGKQRWTVRDASSSTDWATSDGVEQGAESRLAIVVTGDSGAGTVTATFYRDGVSAGSRTGSPGEFPADTLTNLIVGAMNGADLTGWSPSPSAISVNEVRVFHFDEGQFDPFNDLLTGPTPVPDQPPAVVLLSPTNGQRFLTGDSVSASAMVLYGTGPYSVQYWTNSAGGEYVPAGDSSAAPPFQVALGTLAAGSYHICAVVTDATNGMAASVTNSITVAEPSITVDKDYTFNSGPEPDLAAFFKTGSEVPDYHDGKVTLGPNTYLRGAGLYSVAPVNFGVEIILSQTSDTMEERWILDTNPGYQFVLYGKQGWWARDDSVGLIQESPGVTPGAECRLAIVVSGNPDGTVTETFYRDGVDMGGRTGGPGEFPSAVLSELIVGAAQRSEWTGWSATPSAIEVDEIRVFHFDPGIFTPSFLLAEPTPVPLTATFSAAPTNGSAPLTVNFTDNSTPGPTGAITNRFWDFGDGVFTNTVETNLIHTYTASGTNSVKLIVSDAGGVLSTNTRLGCIVVTPSKAPTANFVAEPVSGEMPLTVTFTDTSTGSITNHYWEFGDGTTTNTTLTIFSHTYTASGTNTVKLVVSGSSGAATNTQTGLIRVLAPAASYREAVLRDGPVAYYEMNETGGVVAADTMGTVNGTYGAGVLLGQGNQDVPSLGRGARLTTVSGPGLLALPDDPRLQTSGNFSLEFWYRQAQTTVTDRNQLVRPAGNGSDASFFECFVMGDGATYCNGGFTASGASPFNVWHHLVVTRDSSNYAYWYLDGNPIAVQVYPSLLLTPGVGTSFGGGGAGGSAFEGALDEVAIYTNVLAPARIAAHYAAAANPMPVTASFDAAPTNGYAPLTVTFTDSSIGAPVTNRYWDFGDGVHTNTTATTVVHSFAAPYTTNTVRLIVSGPLNTSTNTQTGLVVVGGWEPVNASFSASPTSGIAPLTVTFGDLSTGPVTNRLWSFGDGTVTNASVTNLTHTYTNAGTYGVQLVVGGLAGNSTNSRPGLILVAAPIPPTPVLSGGGLKISAGVPVFRFATVPGVKYGLDFRTSLTSGAWQPLLVLPDYPPPGGWSAISTGAPMTLTDTNAVNQLRRYYRLKAVYP